MKQGDTIEAPEKFVTGDVRRNVCVMTSTGNGGLQDRPRTTERKLLSLQFRFPQMLLQLQILFMTRKEGKRFRRMKSVSM